MAIIAAHHVTIWLTQWLNDLLISTEFYNSTLDLELSVYLENLFLVFITPIESRRSLQHFHTITYRSQYLVTTFCQQLVRASLARP